MDSRQSLRKKLQQQRARLTLIDQAVASAKIIAQLINHPIFKQSHIIAGYSAIHHEINPDALIKKAWQSHKRCYLPVLHEEQLIFSAYSSDTRLKKNHFNIPEPPLLPETIIKSCDLDLVLVPLLAFTEQGQRLGRGGGFYDKSFSFLLKKPRPLKPFLLGLAYEWQRLEFLEEKAWDISLNAVATEARIYLCVSSIGSD